MDPIKDAFSRVKRDMDSLYFEIDSLRVSLKEMNWRISMLSKDIKNLSESSKPQDNLVSTHTDNTQTQKPDFSTDQTHIKPLNGQIQPISTGNEGVPTDRQTLRQTDQQTQKYTFDEKYMIKTTPKNQNPIQSAAEILDSLDSLKKEIRLKFKRLTEREILVFSTLYQLDEENGFADYKTIATKLNLTESSIRDYVGRLISKGIPVDKKKINNKSVQLSVSQDLKKVATLPTIMQLISL